MEDKKEEKPKAYTYAKVRETNKDAYKKWNNSLDTELKLMYYDSISIADMAIHFGRTKGAISSRINKLNLM